MDAKQGLWGALVKAAGQAAQVGVGQLANASAAPTGKKKKLCTPCAAMKQADAAKAGVQARKLVLR